MVTKTTPKKVAKPKVATKSQASSLSANVVGTDGKAKGTVELPKALFAAKENKHLVAQAVRVYSANQREGSAHTKTRGEVSGSTRKIYRQKGTGRARHGAIRAPIFVGGGTVFGPQAHSMRMAMPQKMRRAALASALSQQLKAGVVHIVSGMQDLAPKTKVMATTLSSIDAHAPVLMVLAKGSDKVKQGLRNIPNVDITNATSLHAYDVLSHRSVVFMKEAIAEL